MEPNERYTQVIKESFHITQGAIDISTGDNGPCQVMVEVDGKIFLICTLQKTKCIQSPLDLYFSTGATVTFLTNGSCNIHLTGYLKKSKDSDDEGSQQEQDEETQSGRDNNKRKLTNKDESLVIKKPKRASEDSESSADESADEKHQKNLNGGDIDSDDSGSYDSSKASNSSATTESSDDEDEDDEEENDEEEHDEDEDDRVDIEKEEEHDDVKEEKEEQNASQEADTTVDTSKESKIDMSKLTKSQKKRLKKKQKKAQKLQQNGADLNKMIIKDEKAQLLAIKTPEIKKESGETSVDKNEKKSLSGGVVIEDITVGTGSVARPGQTVMVHYEGRLKHNNMMFDSCKKGPGFKFRLGAKEVIAGWDVGVAGMRVGGHRRIICPPAMAYGAKGSPPIIPSNATLVFEVELKNVK